MTDGETTIRLRFTNDRSHTCTLAVEPWGDTYEMEPGETYDLVAVGPPDGSLIEIVQSDSAIAVYAWSGAVVSLYNGETELGAGTGPREAAP